MCLIPWGSALSVECKLFEDRNHYIPKVLHNAQGLKKYFLNQWFSPGVVLLPALPPGTFGNLWRQFWWSQLTSSAQRSGILTTNPSTKGRTVPTE